MSCVLMRRAASLSLSPRALQRESTSSMKMMEGLWARAWANRSLTRAGPTPTNISMKSEPLMERKGTLASPAVALASRVLPVPGGPTSRAPLGILAPRSRYLLGCFRKSTNSMISILASSQPATSLNVIFSFAALSRVLTLARTMPKKPPGPPPLLPFLPPIPMRPPRPPVICRIWRLISQYVAPMMSSVGMMSTTRLSTLTSCTYLTGTMSADDMPSSSCASSSLRSKLSTDPIWK
mmetsp:Transcript_27205/g.59430  ORF Transcript_27205/g.59430 Transcript_27205/m.59430 type:complete len:237 (-) Transcript_27205:800-1510(-)